MDKEMKLAAVAQKLDHLSEAEIQQLAGVGILTEEDLYQVRRALKALSMHIWVASQLTEF